MTKSVKLLVLSLASASLLAVCGYFLLLADSSFATRLYISRAWLVVCLASALLFLLKERTTIIRFWVEPDSAVNLAIFRLIFFGVFAVTLLFHPAALNEMIEPWLKMPDSARLSLPIVGDPYAWLNFSHSTVAQLVVVWKVALFCSFLGFLTPISVTTYCLLTAYLFGIPQFFGKINHEHFLVWFSAILAVSRCADTLSIDAALRSFFSKSSLRSRVSVKYGLPLRFVWVLIGIIYFFPGFWKIWDCGFDWAFTDNLRNQMYLKWSEMGDWLPPFRIDYFPALYILGGTGTVLFELSFVFLIFFKKTRWVAPIAGLTFHLFGLIFMNINFMLLVICYSAFINWEGLFAKLFKPSKDKPDPSASSRQPLVLAMGVFLITMNLYCGVFKVNSWPFAVFPLFNSLIDEHHYSLHYGKENLTIKEALSTHLPSERLRALENRIILSHLDGEFAKRDELLNDFISAIPEELNLSSADFAVATLSLVPEKKDQIIELEPFLRKPE